MNISGLPPDDPGDDYEAPYIGDDVYAEIDDTYQMGARLVSSYSLLNLKAGVQK